LHLLQQAVHFALNCVIAGACDLTGERVQLLVDLVDLIGQGGYLLFDRGTDVSGIRSQVSGEPVLGKSGSRRDGSVFQTFYLR